MQRGDSLVESILDCKEIEILGPSMFEMEPGQSTSAGQEEPVLLPAEATLLPAPSLALCHQVRTASARRLSPAKGRLDDGGLRADVEHALRLWLSLDRPPGGHR